MFVVNPTDMVVTWVTMQSTIVSIVEYGIDDLNKTAKGYEDVFVDGGGEKRMMYIHRVTVTGLRPGQKYSEYNCVELLSLRVDKRFVVVSYQISNMFVNIAMIFACTFSELRLLKR